MACNASCQNVFFCLLLFCSSLAAVPLREEFETREMAHFDATIGQMDRGEDYLLNNESQVWTVAEQGERFAAILGNQVNQSQNSDFNETSTSHIGNSGHDRCEGGLNPCNLSSAQMHDQHSDSKGGKEGRDKDTSETLEFRNAALVSAKNSPFMPASPPGPSSYNTHHQVRRLLEVTNSTVNANGTSLSETSAAFTTTSSVVLGGGGGSSTSGANIVSTTSVLDAIAETSAPFSTTAPLGGGQESSTSGSGIFVTTAMSTTVGDLLSSTDTLFQTPEPTGVSLNSTEMFAETSATSFFAVTPAPTVAVTPTPVIVITTTEAEFKSSTSAPLVGTAEVTSIASVLTTVVGNPSNETFAESTASFTTSFFSPFSTRAGTTRLGVVSSTTAAVISVTGVSNTPNPLPSNVTTELFETTAPFTTPCPGDTSLCSCGAFGPGCNSSCNMSITCSGNGRCNGLTGGCDCFYGWIGDNCSVSGNLTDVMTTTVFLGGPGGTSTTTSARPETSSTASFTTSFFSPFSTRAGTTRSSVGVISSTTAAVISVTGVSNTPNPSPSNVTTELFETTATFSTGTGTAGSTPIQTTQAATDTGIVTTVLGGGAVTTTTDATPGSTVSSSFVDTTQAIITTTAMVSTGVFTTPTPGTPLSITVTNTITVDEDGVAPTAAVAETKEGDVLLSTGITYTLTQMSTVSGSALFSSDPSINAAGILSFTLAADSNGDTIWEVIASDATRQSTPAYLTISVTPINDAPTVTVPGAQISIDGDFSGTMTDFDFLSAISAGPNEDSQTVSWTISGDTTAIGISSFVQGSDPTKGTYTATSASGEATVTLTVMDDGGTANEGVNIVTTTFTIVRQQLPSTFAQNVEAQQTDLGEISVSWTHDDIVAASQRGASSATSFYIRVVSCSSESVCIDSSFAGSASVAWDASECDSSTSTCTTTVSGLGRGWHRVTVYVENIVCAYTSGCSKFDDDSIDTVKLIEGPSAPLDVNFMQTGTLDLSTTVFAMSWSRPEDNGDGLPASDPQRVKLAFYEVEIDVAGSTYSLTDLSSSVTVQIFTVTWASRDAWSFTMPDATVVSGMRGDEVLFKVKGRNALYAGIYGEAPVDRVIKDPGSVRNLRATELVDETGVYVSWDRPEDTGFGDDQAEIKAYRVEMSKCSNFDATQLSCAWVSVPVRGTNTSHLFSSDVLQAGSVYFFRVTAENRLGYGVVSQAVNAEFKMLPHILLPLQADRPLFAAITASGVDVWTGSVMSSTIQLLVYGFPLNSTAFSATADGGLSLNPTVEAAGSRRNRILLGTPPSGPTFGDCTVSQSQRCELGVSVFPSDRERRFVRFFIFYFEYLDVQVLEQFPLGGSASGDSFLRLKIEDYVGPRTRAGAGLASLSAGQAVTVTFTCGSNTAIASDVLVSTDAAAQHEALDGVLRLTVSMYTPASPCSPTAGTATISFSTATGESIPLAQSLSYEFLGPRIDYVTPSSGVIVDGSQPLELVIVLRDVGAEGTITVKLGDEVQATNGGGTVVDYIRTSDTEVVVRYSTPTYYRSQKGDLTLTVTGFAQDFTTTWKFVAPPDPTIVASSIMIDDLAKNWMSAQLTTSTVSFTVLNLASSLGWNLNTVRGRVSIDGTHFAATPAECPYTVNGPNLDVECTFEVAQFTVPALGAFSVTVSDREALSQAILMTERGNAIPIGIRNPEITHVDSFAAREGPAEGGTRILVGLSGASGLMSSGDVSVDFGGVAGTVNGVVPLEDWNSDGDEFETVMVATNIWSEMQQSGKSLSKKYSKVVKELNKEARHGLTPALLVLTTPAMANDAGSVTVTVSFSGSSFTLGRQFKFVAARTGKGLALGRTSDGKHRGGRHEGGRFECELPGFPLVFNFEHIVVNFGGFFMKIAQLLFSTSEMTSIILEIPQFQDVGSVSVQIYTEGSNSADSAFELSFEFEDDSQPVVIGYSLSQVYYDGGYELSASLSNFPENAQADDVEISLDFSDGSTAISNATLIMRTQTATIITFTSVSGPVGSVLVSIVSFGKTTSYQIHYVELPSVPVSFTRSVPSMIVCDGSTSMSIVVEDMPVVDSESQLSITINNVAVTADAFSIISTFDETMIVLQVPALSPSSIGVIDPSAVPNDIDSSYPATFSVNVEISYAQRSSVNLISDTITCTNPYASVVEYTYPVWGLANTTAEFEVSVSHFGIVTEADLYWASASSELHIMSMQIIASSAERTVLALDVMGSTEGEFNMHVWACTGACGSYSARNVSIPITLYNNGPRVTYFTPTSEFTYGDVTMAVHVVNLDPTSPFSAATLDLDGSTSITSISVTYGGMGQESSAVFSFTLPTVRRAVTYFNPALAITGGPTLSLPRHFEYVEPPAPSLDRFLPSFASTSASSTVRMFLSAFPGAEHLTQISVFMLWGVDTLVSASVLSLTQVDATLDPAEVQSFILDVATPVGVDQGDVTCIVWNSKFGPAIASSTGFRFGDSNRIKTTRAESAVDSGKDSVTTIMSEPSEIALTIENAPDVPIEEYVVMLDDTQTSLIRSSYDSSTVSALIQAPGGRFPGTMYGFVSFGGAGSCSTDCCKTHTCTADCDGVSLACFSITYIDDTQPTARFQPTSGPSTGGTVVSMVVGNFPMITDASEVLVLFGSDITSGSATVVLTYSNPEETGLELVVPAMDIGDDASISVRVTVVPISRADRTFSFWFTYKAVSPSVRSVSPASGLSTGGVKVTTTIANFPFPSAGIAVLFDGLLVPFHNVSVLPNSDAHATSISFTTLSSDPGMVTVTVVPKDCAVVPCPSQVSFAFEQIDPDQPYIMQPIPFRGPVQTSVFPLVRFGKWPVDVQSFNISFTNSTHVLATVADTIHPGNGSVLFTTPPGVVIGDWIVMFDILESTGKQWHVEMTYKIYDGTSIYLVSSMPGDLPTSTTVDGRQLALKSTVSVVVANMPQGLTAANIRLLVGAGVKAEIVAVSDLASCAPTAIDCLRTRIDFKAPVVDSPGVYPASLSERGSTTGALLDFSLTFVPPCDWDAFCGTKGFFTNFMRLLSTPIADCKLEYCEKPEDIQQLSVLFTTPSEGPTIGGTVVTVEFQNLPALGATDVSVATGVQGLQDFADVDAVQHYAPASLLQNSGKLLLTMPSVLPETGLVTFTIQTSLGGQPVEATFDFLYLPVITGPPTSIQFSPAVLQPSQPLSLYVELGNFPKLAFPFDADDVTFFILGDISGPTAVDSIVSSTADSTAVMLSAVPPSATWSVGTLQVTIYATSMGVNNAVTIDLSVQSETGPFVQSVFPTEGLVSRSLTVTFKIPFMDTATTVSDLSVNSITVLATSTTLSIVPVVSDLIALHDSSCTDRYCSVFDVVVEIPAVSAAALNGGSDVTVVLSSTLETSAIETNLFKFVLRKIELFEPQQQTLVQAGTEAITIYLVNFPSMACSMHSNCSAEVIDLDVAFGGFSGAIVDVIDVGSLLEVTVMAPPVAEPAMVDVVVTGTNAMDEFVAVSAGFEFAYTQPAPVVVPVDGVTKGGTVLVVTAYGWGQTSLTVTNPEKVQCQIDGRDAVVISILDIQYTEAFSYVQMQIVTPRANRKTTGIVSGVCTLVEHPEYTSPFEFEYYEAPDAKADPDRAKLTGETETKSRRDSDSTRSFSTVVSVTGFPQVSASEDVEVYFAHDELNPADLTADHMAEVTGVAQSGEELLITVTVPPVSSRGRARIWVRYAGPASNVIRDEKWAETKFQYKGSEAEVKKMKWCEVCNTGNACIESKRCADRQRPLDFEAPAPGVGVVTVELKHVPAVMYDDNGQIWDSTSIAIAIGPDFGTFIRMIDGRRERVEFEMALPSITTPGTYEGEIILSYPGQQTPITAPFEFTFSLGESAIFCADCQGPTEGADAVTLRINNMQLSTDVALLDQVSITFGDDERAAASATLVSSNETMTIISVTPPTYDCASCVFSNGQHIAPLTVTSLQDDDVSITTNYVFWSAPSIVVAEFATQGTSISVIFDQPTNRGGMDLDDSNCSAVLLPRIVDSGMLGMDPNSTKCVFDSDSSFKIFLGPGATIAPDDVLEVSSGAIFSRNLISAASTATAIVRGPDRTNRPEVSVSGPEVIDPCAGLKLEAFADSPRPLTFTWGCKKCSKDLQRTLKQFTTGVMQLGAGTPELEDLDEKYEFTVSAVDFLGAESKTVTKKVTKLSTAIPQVTFTPEALSTRYDKDILIKASVSFSDCPIDTGDVELSWKAVSDPKVPKAYMNSKTAELYIPANTLASGNSYTVELKTRMASDRSKSSKTEYTFSVVRLPLVALIDKLDITESTQSVVALDASASFDSDSGTSAGLVYAWRCYLIVDGDEQACLDLTNTVLSLGTSAAISIPANSLAADTYMFEVTVRKTGSSKSPAKSTAMVTMVNDPIPSAAIVAVGPSTLLSVPARINAVDALVLEGSCSDAAGGVEWVFDHPLDNDASIISFGFNQLQFRIEPDSDQFVGGATVNAKFLCTGANGLVAEARMAIAVNAPPTGGSCKVCKAGGASGECSQTGEAWVDAFVLRCDDWGDDEGDDIRYQFGSQIGNSEMKWGEVEDIRESVQSFPEGVVSVYFRVIDGLNAESSIFVETLTIEPASARRRSTSGSRRLLQLSSTNGLTQAWSTNLGLVASALQRKQGAATVDLVGKLAAQAASQHSSGTLSTAEAMQINGILLDALVSAKAVATETSGFICSSINAAQIAVGAPSLISPTSASTAVGLVGDLFKNLTTATVTCSVHSIDVVGNAIASLQHDISCSSSGSEAQQASALAAEVLSKAEDSYDLVAIKFSASLTAGQGLQLLAANRSRHAVGLESMSAVTGSAHVLQLGSLISNTPSAIGNNVTLTVPSSVITALGLSTTDTVTVDLGVAQTAPVIAGIKSLSPLVTVSLYDSAGSAVSVSQLADPISIMIPINTNSLCASELAIWEKTGTCMVWTGAAYSAAGCTTVMHSSNVVTCKCDHLSSFIVAADLGEAPVETTAAAVLETTAVVTVTTNQESQATTPTPTEVQVPGTTDAATPDTTSAVVVVTPSAPTFSVGSDYSMDDDGYYPGFVEVTVIPPEGSSVSYKTDGATPVCPSSVSDFTSEIVLLKNTDSTNSLQAVACHPSGGVSSTVSAEYEVKAAPYVRAILSFSGVSSLTDTMIASLAASLATELDVHEDRIESSESSARRRLLQSGLSVQTDVLATSLAQAASLSDDAKATQWSDIISGAEGWEGATFTGASVSVIDPTTIPPIPEPEEEGGLSTNALLAIILPSVIGGLLLIGLCAFLVWRSQRKPVEPLTPADPLEASAKTKDQRTSSGGIYKGHDDPEEVERRLMGGKKAEPPAPTPVEIPQPTPFGLEPVTPGSAFPAPTDEAAELLGPLCPQEAVVASTPAPTGFAMPTEQYMLQPTSDVGVLMPLHSAEISPTVNPYTPAHLRAAAEHKAAVRRGEVPSGTGLLDYPHSLYQSVGAQSMYQSGIYGTGEDNAYGLQVIGAPFISVPQLAAVDYPQSLFVDDVMARLADPEFGGFQELQDHSHQTYLTSEMVYGSPPMAPMAPPRDVWADGPNVAMQSRASVAAGMPTYVPPWERAEMDEVPRAREAPEVQLASNTQPRYLPPWEREAPAAHAELGFKQAQHDNELASSSDSVGLEGVQPQMVWDAPMPHTVDPYSLPPAPTVDPYASALSSHVDPYASTGLFVPQAPTVDPYASTQSAINPYASTGLFKPEAPTVDPYSSSAIAPTMDPYSHYAASQAEQYGSEIAQSQAGGAAPSLSNASQFGPGMSLQASGPGVSGAQEPELPLPGLSLQASHPAYGSFEPAFPVGLESQSTQYGPAGSGLDTVSTVFGPTASAGVGPGPSLQADEGSTVGTQPNVALPASLNLQDMA